MKRIMLTFTILLILSLTFIASADLLSTSVSRWSTGSGGVTTGGEYRLSTIMGQPMAGSQSGGDFHLIWGFWQPDPGATVYLPMFFKTSSTRTLLLLASEVEP